MALVCKRPEQDLDKDRQQDDGYAVILHKLVEKEQKVEQWLGDNIGPAYPSIASRDESKSDNFCYLPLCRGPPVTING